MLMNRDQLIRLLRKEARKAGIKFKVVKNRGKGGHYLIYLGSRRTTIQSGELRPEMVKTIRRQLDLE